ncbi:hypothetical protein, conserved [Eimeria praecox]|uniref:Lysosomal cobalamin transporter n=1 Tax=Eimeria praecox TaxID=51316 RepID=U6H462_9EIME|nr:hypothetical protein, conserved [Eimeria praecox]
MLLVGLGAAIAAGAAFVLPLLLYYHFVDRRKSTPIAALSFCSTLTLALLLALLVPIDIMQASTANSDAIQKAEASQELQQAPSVAEAAAAAHASNTAAAAFTPAGAAAAAAAAAGWAALRKAALPLTPEALQQLYLCLGIAVFFCCFILTPAAIFYANESDRRQTRSCVGVCLPCQLQDIDEVEVLSCGASFAALKKTVLFVVAACVLLLLLLAVRPGMPPPAFLRPEEARGPQEQLQQQQQQHQKGNPAEGPAGLMAAAAAAASAAAATASAAAAAAAAAAQRVDSDAVQLYTAQLLGVHKTGVDSLLYLGACFLCGAQGVWIIFGAFGLACLPLAWMQRRPSTEQKQQQLQHAIASIREQQRLLQNKYAGGRQMSPLDAETFQQLRAQQRICSEKKYKLQALSLRFRVGRCLCDAGGRREDPLSLFGVLSFASALSADLGFAAAPPAAPAADIFGHSPSRHKRLREWQRHVSVKGGSSSPQVLLLMSSLLAHLILAAGLCLFTAAPQYASFGNQTFVPQNGSDAITCSLHAAAAGTSCRLTVFAAALSRVAFATPLLASLLYCSNWCFLMGVLLCLVYVAAWQRAVTPHSSAWDSQQHRTATGAAGRDAAGDLDDLAVVDESSRLIGV